MTRIHKRLTGVMVREVEQEVLLLDVESDKIHQLNQTASFIWRRCEDLSSAEELAALLAQEFEVEQSVALRDVHETLSRLRALKLIGEAG